MLTIAYGTALSRPDLAGINPWPITIGIRDLRKALAAFQIREPALEPDLPEAAELNALAWGNNENRGLEGVRAELMRRNVQP